MAFKAWRGSRSASHADMSAKALILCGVAALGDFPNGNIAPDLGLRRGVARQIEGWLA